MRSDLGESLPTINLLGVYLGDLAGKTPTLANMYYETWSSLLLLSINGHVYRVHQVMSSVKIVSVGVVVKLILLFLLHSCVFLWMIFFWSDDTSTIFLVCVHHLFTLVHICSRLHDLTMNL